MSVNQGNVIDQIQVYQSAVVSKMNLMVINNTGNVLDGISVLGRIPFTGNKSVLTGEELGTTVDTYLKSYIRVNNIDENKVKIYYSENGEATRDLTKEDNAWKENIEDTTKIKSFMIVVNDYQMNPGEIIGFAYDLEIPKDITYNNSMLSNFATYYTEYADEISKQNETQSDIVGITTGKGPELAIEQEIIGKNDDGTVNEYGLLKFRVKVSNNGTETANNVVIHDQIPKWTDYVKSTVENNTSRSNTIKYSENEDMKAWDVIENGNFEKNTTPKLEWKVDKINPGESVTKEFEVMAQAVPGIYEYYRNYNGVSLGEDGRTYIVTQTYNADTDSSEESKNEITSVPDIDITNIATVTASNFDAELKASSDTLTLKKLNIRAEEVLGTNNSVYAGEGDEISYSISVSNSANKGGITTTYEQEQAKEKIVKNLKIEKHMPEGIKYKSAEVTKMNLEDGTETKLEANYDEARNILTINCDELGLTDSVAVLIKGKTNKLEEGVYEKEISTNTQISAEGCETIDTNTVTFMVKKPQLYMLVNSSSQNQYLTDGEIVEYDVELKNLSEIIATGIQFEYKIPEGLEFVSGTKNVFGVESSVYEDSLGNVMMYCSLKENESATVKIKMKVLPLSKDTDISNIFTVSGDNVDLDIQTIDQTIEKSSNSKPNGDKDNSGDNNGGQADGKNIKISGIAWLDSNENGKRDTNEDLLGNIKVMAIDAQSGKIAINTKGDEAITTTSSTGSYLLENLQEGNYLIAFFYDTAVYTVTQYQAKDVSALLNSDAIEREIVQDGIKSLAGITDTLTVQKSMSNIDLGLVTKQKFDLKLEKSVAKVSVQNKEGVKVYEFDNTKLAQIPITGKQLKNSTIVVEYKLKVTNEGNVAGFAKNIVDYLPKELSFNSELNSNWYVGNDNNLYNTSLAEQVINPGESKELTIVLTKKLSEDSTGIINNNAEIKESYNEYGLKDRDSVAGNNIQGEDDQDSADIIITVRTGGGVIAISLITISIFIACLIALIYIRKNKKGEEIK